LLYEYGGPEALELQQKAVKAFNSGHHDKAIDLLRKALVASGGVQSRVRVAQTKSLLAFENLERVSIVGGSEKLREELSSILTKVAELKMIKPGMGSIRSVLPMLEEALELDPMNTQAAMLLRLIKSSPGLH
jgi:hypothetical protein